MIVFNDILPFKGYRMMTLFPLIFARNDVKIRSCDVNHEKIHLCQQAETLVVLFFVWYCVEYLVRLVLYGSHNEAYRNISFEQEAYLNEGNAEYIPSRKLYSWIKYIGRKTYEKKD